jgi:hypothetical protein
MAQRVFATEDSIADGEPWTGVKAMNYGEELGYWYLRLNGFFPLSNVVLHGGETLRYTSDCDLLAVRPPHVYEVVGGQMEDWDPKLYELFEGGWTLGVVCEVKTGAFDA